MNAHLNARASIFSNQSPSFPKQHTKKRSVNVVLEIER